MSIITTVVQVNDKNTRTVNTQKGESKSSVLLLLKIQLVNGFMHQRLLILELKMEIF